jgi:NitT/TauT family transport system permease protein
MTSGSIKQLFVNRQAPARAVGEGATPKRAARRWRVPGVRFKSRVPLKWKLLLGGLTWLALLALWQMTVSLEWVNVALLPAPAQVVTTTYTLFAEQAFFTDVKASVIRVLISFGLACGVAIPLGVLMGAFPIVQTIINPIVSPARYLPAPSFIPLLLMWLGPTESQKVALLILGVIWFLVTAVMDHTQNSHTELIETAYTLGASKKQVLMRVIVPETLPHIMTAMRQMLAISWTYLVIAEIVTATDGIGAMMWKARRFVHTDQMIAGILVIGLLGFTFDAIFRLLHRWWFPHQYGQNE